MVGSKIKKGYAQERAYIHLYQSIKERILSLRIKEGEKIPSKRQLADDFGVSVITVEHALQLLMDEGYLEPKQRSGYYVTYREGTSYEYAKKEVSRTMVPLKVNGIKTDAVSYPMYAKTIRKTLTDYGESILERSPNEGCLRLRQALADYLYANRDLHVAPEQIIIGAGAEYLYGILLQILGRKLWYGIESPSYEKIELVYKANEVHYLSLPLGEKGIQSEALWKADFNVLHVSPYRSYPSGVSADASKRREYLNWANKKPGRFVIEDDFESEFYPSSKSAETIFSVAAASGQENVIYMNTFSKTVSSSIRTGYLVLPKSMVKVYQERAGFYSCAVPTFEQYVLAEYIESGEFSRNINRIRRKNRRER